MTALKVLAVLVLVAGIAIEVAGRHPGGLGFAGNAGAMIAVVLWAVATFSAHKPNEGRRP